MRMQHTVGGVVSCLSGGLILAAIASLSVEMVRAAPAQENGSGSLAQQALLVEAGRAAYGQACVQCHGPNRTVIQRKAEAGWRRTVYAMISRGSPLMADEIEPLTAYLTATYGPDSPLPGAGGDGALELPDAAGRSILTATCTQCHAVEMVTGSQKTESQWLDTIDLMIGYGAEISDADQETLASYAAANFGQ